MMLFPYKKRLPFGSHFYVVKRFVNMGIWAEKISTWETALNSGNLTKFAQKRQSLKKNKKMFF